MPITTVDPGDGSLSILLYGIIDGMWDITAEEFGPLLFAADNRSLSRINLRIGLDSDQPPKAYMTTPESEFLPRISPAGDAIVYRHRPGGATLGLLYAVAYPSPGVPVQVSLTPVEEEYGWLGGGEVFWGDSSHRLWSAAVTTKDGQIDAATPKEMLTSGGGHPLDEHTLVFTLNKRVPYFLDLMSMPVFYPVYPPLVTA